MLQWSHRLSAMETSVKARTGGAFVLASMEPPPFGDGNMTFESEPGPDWPGLQWSHRLSAMETLSGGLGPVHGVVASMEPPPFGDGNMHISNEDPLRTQLQWSHRLSAMETAARPVAPLGVLEASMEPPPFGDGNTTKFWTCRPSKSLQWSHRLSAMETRARPAARIAQPRLQWSHRLSAMETGRRHPGRTGGGGFNGATAFRRWKPGEGGRHPDNAGASMEPPPFGDGNAVVAIALTTETEAELQWSHRLSAMETRGERGTLPAHHATASMEPPPFGDGNLVYRHVRPVADGASMEPPPFGDGNRLCQTSRRAWKAASMEPPPFGDGNMIGRPLATGTRHASMEPPPFGDGNCSPWLASAVNPAKYALLHNDRIKISRFTWSNWTRISPVLSGELREVQYDICTFGPLAGLVLPITLPLWFVGATPARCPRGYNSGCPAPPTVPCPQSTPGPP